MKKIYISGKITGLALEEAWRLFNEAERMLKAQGMQPVNPMKIQPISYKKTWEEYMVKDIEALFDCQAIYMLSNWQSSKGARIELAIAREMEMKVLWEEEVSENILQFLSKS